MESHGCFIYLSDDLLAQGRRNVSSSASKHSFQKPTDTWKNKFKLRWTLSLIMLIHNTVYTYINIYIYNIHQGAQQTWQYFSMYRTRNEATGAERTGCLYAKGWKAGLCGSPAVFHVLGFVHPYGKFDLQILVRTRLGYSHFMKFRLFGAVGSWVKDDLHAKQKDAAAISVSHVTLAEFIIYNYMYRIIHNYIFKTIKMNKPWELYRRGVPEKTIAFLPTPLQQDKKEPCHEPKVTASTGTSVER